MSVKYFQCFYNICFNTDFGKENSNSILIKSFDNSRARHIALYVNQVPCLMGDGIQLVREIANILINNRTEILAGSVNSTEEACVSIFVGTQHLTLPLEVLKSFITNPHSERTIKNFRLMMSVSLHKKRDSKEQLVLELSFESSLFITLPQHQLWSILQRLRQVHGLNLFILRQVCNRARQLEHAMIPPCRQIQLAHRLPHQIVPRFI